VKLGLSVSPSAAALGFYLESRRFGAESPWLTRWKRADKRCIWPITQRSKDRNLLPKQTLRHKFLHVALIAPRSASTARLREVTNSVLELHYFGHSPLEPSSSTACSPPPPPTATFKLYVIYYRTDKFNNSYMVILTLVFQMVQIRIQKVHNHRRKI
jgi:hypothetical protein